MTNHSDLTFITNEQDQNLLERFKVLIKDTKFFDVLVGYFYSSGFDSLYKSLEETQKIRILIGISTNKEVTQRIKQSQEKQQYEMPFSSAEIKEHFSKDLIQEMDNSQDKKEIYDGVQKFIEWLKSGKLEIKAYPSTNIHAKLYIMSFAEGDRDKGRVITGSSNFTKSGLIDNLEFNVELKTSSDYEFALQKFNQLWEGAVDLKDKYLKTIQTKTWLNNNITPYELYLKFLYEYFKEELKPLEESFLHYTPYGFKQLEYQNQAVQNAKRILLEYGGVFLSDVVGLGKTYMSAMSAGLLDGRSLVLAPPFLLQESNPGSWKNVFSDFRIHADFESLGKLDKLIERGVDKYKNIFIDEAHRFRKETNITYEKLAEICRGKRVILVTATPFNNTPLDLLSQIKLFQSVRKSKIPNIPNLEKFFGELDQKIQNTKKTRTLKHTTDKGSATIVSDQKNHTNLKNHQSEYMKAIKQSSKKIREQVLKYLMVRRTRTEIKKYFAEDLKKQNVHFPEVQDPKPLFYQFSKKENEAFHQTVDLIGKYLKYARYCPLTYYKYPENLSQPEIQSQKNLEVFMKILLVKRLESSFFAFKNSINRFVNSYELFLKEFKAGHVYVSKKYANKIFNFLNDENEEAINKLLNEDKAKEYKAQDFNKSLSQDLESDLQVLKKIQSLWEGIDRDPKLLSLINALSSSSQSLAKSHNQQAEQALYPQQINVLRENKLIIFTESKETAEYLGEELNKNFPNKALVFTGSSKVAVRDLIIQNFDAKSRHLKDDYRILVTTEVLSEGVNLHRSNVVVNYDIPWNPTRLIQRVGRINRVDTSFDKIYTFNFFPTEESNNIINLEEIAKTKIEAFINLLGADARLLTEEEEITSHELFGKLSSKKTIEEEVEEEESELKYLKVIQGIRDQDPDLFNKIKLLPKKARTCTTIPAEPVIPEKAGIQTNLSTEEQSEGRGQLLTYFRKGKLQKFCLAREQKPAIELDFTTSARLLECEQGTKRNPLPKDFYNKLQKNKDLFLSLTVEEEQFTVSNRSGADSETKLLKILKATQGDLRQLTEEQEIYFQKVIERIREGALPKQTIKTNLKIIQAELKTSSNQLSALKVLAILKRNISDSLLEKHISENPTTKNKPREVILSEYFIKE